MSVPLEFWEPHYTKALFILSNTFRPGVDFSVQQSSDAMKCFVISVTKMLPDPYMKEKWMNYIVMTKEVSHTLVNHLPRFFSVYPKYAEVMLKHGPEFLSTCAQSNESMFIWVYLLRCYMFILLNQQSKIESLYEVKQTYNPKLLSKYDWGNPLWFIIHMSALYAPQPLATSFEDYKSLLSCLQYLLPCPKCRNHLRENLTKINLDRCAKTTLELFKCSVDLHNIVNVSKDKPTPAMGYEEAIKLYMP